MSVDVEQFGGLLSKVETRMLFEGRWDAGPAGRGGWLFYDGRVADTDTALRRAFSRFPEVGAPSSHGPYRAIKFLPGQWFAHGPAGMTPVQGLRKIALLLAYGGPNDPDVRTMSRSLLLPGVVGVAYGDQGWRLGGEEVGPQVLARVVRGDLPATATGGARMVRALCGIDIDGGAHVVHRIYGEPPELSTNCDYRGDFTTSLRLLVAVVNQDVPPYDKLPELFPPAAAVADELERGGWTSRT